MRKAESLEQNIVYLCSVFSHVFSLRLESEFRKKEISITPEQFSILVLLWNKEGRNQKELSQDLNRDKTTIARVIMNMEKNKLIRQVMDVNDKRAKLLYLTQKGRRILNIALPISGDFYLKILSNIVKDKLKNGIELLQAMINNL